MRKIREVLRLYFAAALSIRAIARSVGTSPSTVADYLRRAEGAGLSWPGDRRRRAGTATVSGFAAEQPVASAAGVERGAPGVGAEGCDGCVGEAPHEPLCVDNLTSTCHACGFSSTMAI